MLQKEINRSYSTFPNDIAFAKLHTGTSENVTGERRSGAFINIWSKREKCFSLNKCEKIECLRDIMKSLSQVRRKFWHQKWLTERWREELRRNWFSSNAQFLICGSFLLLKPNGVLKEKMYLLFMLQKRNRSLCSLLPNETACLLFLGTSAGFPVISIPRIANTAVWTKIVVAFYAYVPQGRRSNKSRKIFLTIYLVLT